MSSRSFATTAADANFTINYGDIDVCPGSGNLLVVSSDEASMLDLALATKLLEAVPDAARIVLLGDKDQLAAVESGAAQPVEADGELIGHAPVRFTILPRALRVLAPPE